MTDLRQVAQQLLEACEQRLPLNGQAAIIDELNNLRTALEQQQAEPVAVHQWRKQGCADWYDGHPDFGDGGGPYEIRTLYTAPPQRKPLTDERILHLVETHVGGPSPSYPLDNSDWINFARAIEAAHGIKEGT